MRITEAKLAKCKSGQTVYRVWGQPDPEDNTRLKLKIERRHFVGKRCHAEPDLNGFNHFRFDWKNKEDHRKWNSTGSIHAEDWVSAHTSVGGVAFFTKRKQAERYVQEVHKGLWPADANHVYLFHEEMDRMDEAMGICDRGLGGYYEENYGCDSDGCEEDLP